MIINLFDFDKTIYDGDSSFDFFFFVLKRKPKIIKTVPTIVINFIKWKMGKISLTQFKEKVFAYLKYIDDVDKLVNNFWETHEKKIKTFYLKRNHESDIIISASPEFLLNLIAKRLNTLDLIASKVNKKTGKFVGLNCHDHEKVKRLKEKYDDFIVMEAFSDSMSDEPILKLAKDGFIVKKNKIIPYNK